MSVIMYLMALENFHQLCSVDLIISDLVSEYRWSNNKFFDAGTQWLLEGDHMVRIMTSSSPGISVIGMGG